MRLIDADAIEWGEQLVPYGNGKYEYMRIAYMDDIDDLPTVKPERKKGTWTVYTDCEGKGRRITCDQCGYEAWNWCNLNFCPNCGADMRGEEE